MSAPSSPSPSPSPEDPAAYFRLLGEQASKVLTAAEEAGQGIREQARKDAAGIIADAHMQAEEVARQSAAQRRAAEEELRKFREARTIIANQIEDLHRRLEEVILRLRTPVDAPATPGAPPGPKAAPSPPPAAEPAQEAFLDQEPPAAEESLESPAAEESAPPEEPPVPSAEEPVPESLEVAASPEEPPAAELEPASLPSPPAESEEPEEAPAAGQPELPVEVALPQTMAFSSADLAEVEEASEAWEGEPEPAAEPATEAPAEPDGAEEAVRRRSEALGDAPAVAARTLKRLLAEDQNDLLDRIRRHRGRGNFDNEIFPAEPQVERFVDGLRGVLQPAFLAGRRLGGAPAIGEQTADAVGALVAKQVVGPLRRDLARMIEPRLVAGDTATTVSERAGDVYRVWKGVRTELLGEGLAYAAFHHGLLDAWREANTPSKRWVLVDETDCPRETCRVNAAAGAVPIDASFPSGHLAPPAHGACACTVTVAPL